MPTAELSLRANKGQAYYNALCKHFARKVGVERAGNVASVAFPMGSCEMSVRGEQMFFRVHAGNQASLDSVKMIIASHVTRFKEFRHVTISWRDVGITENARL